MHIRHPNMAIAKSHPENPFFKLFETDSNEAMLPVINQLIRKNANKTNPKILWHDEAKNDFRSVIEFCGIKQNAKQSGVDYPDVFVFTNDEEHQDYDRFILSVGDTFNYDTTTQKQSATIINVQQLKFSDALAYMVHQDYNPNEIRNTYRMYAMVYEFQIKVDEQTQKAAVIYFHLRHTTLVSAILYEFDFNVTHWVSVRAKHPKNLINTTTFMPFHQRHTLQYAIINCSFVPFEFGLRFAGSWIRRKLFFKPENVLHTFADWTLNKPVQIINLKNEPTFIQALNFV
jgi:hypothetical protein